jgi:uncharacterized protein YndB with AHSA1/START domain
MPTTRRHRTIAAEPERVWDMVSDPYHLPRWWPRVGRVEQVSDHGFTEVFTLARGRTGRADFQITEMAENERMRWAQDLPGTPFERLFTKSETEVRLESQEGGARTKVTLTLDQSSRGFFNKFGGLFFRRAGKKMLGGALDELEKLL